MATKDTKQPIIVKRIKKHAHGHHGGAWKIAYADFVTAMMAFFLLMWLLGSTTKGELQGIAEYFRTPLLVAMTGGSGAGESPNVIVGGGKGIDPTNPDKHKPTTPLEKYAPSPKPRGDGNKQSLEVARMRGLKAKVEAIFASTSSGKLAQFKHQIKLDITPEGLRIQIIDDQARPMFDIGSPYVKDYMRDILREIGAVLNTVEYRVTLTGHTDAAQYASGERGYSNWELSADRANASRRELVAGGMEEGKVLRVVGMGSAMLAEKDDPRAATNRRIHIIVMNAEAEARATAEVRGAEIQANEPALEPETPAESESTKESK